MAADGKDGKPGGQDDKAMEQALNNVERLRRQMEQLQAQRGQQGRRVDSSGQQGGQRRSAKWPARRQQGRASRVVSRLRAATRRTPTAAGVREAAATGTADRMAATGTAAGIPAAPGTARAVRGPTAPYARRTSRTPIAIPCGAYPISNSRCAPTPARPADIRTLIEQLRQIDPYAYANDPLLGERIQAALTTGVEQVEMELRRKVDENRRRQCAQPGQRAGAAGVCRCRRRIFP